MEWRKKRLSVIHHCVSGYRARLWLRNWFDISVVLLGMRNFMRVQGLLLCSLWPSSTRLHRQKSSIWLQSEKKVFATFIYILRWYSYTGSWSIFLIGKFLCYASFFLSSFKFIGWGGIFFVMVMRRYGRLATLFWTQVKIVLFPKCFTFLLAF